MKESIEGIVIEVNDKLAKVKISRHGECSNCGLCPGEDALVVDTPNTLVAGIGQRVILEVKQDNMVGAAFLVYIMPLIAVAVGIYLGYLFSSYLAISKTVPMTIGGIIFAIASLFAIKRLDNSLKTDSHMPKMLKVMK